MDVRIIAEPGRYLVESAFTLAVNIIAKRTVTSSDPAFSNHGKIHSHCFTNKFHREKRIEEKIMKIFITPERISGSEKKTSGK